MKERHLHSNIAHIFGKKLLNYYNFVCSKEYPEELFNRKDGLRCSKFRITGLKKNSRKKICLDLIGSGKIHLINEKNQPPYISKLILNLPKITELNASLLNPSHEKILDKILSINKNALAIEIPVWTTTHQAILTSQLKMSEFSCLCNELFTGHIDLLMFDETDGSVVVCDYKPENHFLTSLPQVAIYGLVVKRILKYPKVKCVSFSGEKAWLYDPEIIRTQIPKYLTIYGSSHLDWQDFVRSI